MIIIISDIESIQKITAYLWNNSYYFSVLELPPEKDYTLVLPQELPIHYADTTIDISNPNFPLVAIIAKKIALKSSLKLKTDLQMLHYFSPEYYESLPIKNETLFFWTYNYFFLKRQKEQNHNLAILIHDDGYGDNIITLAYLHYFAKLKSKQGYKIKFYHFYEPGYHLSEIFTYDYENHIYPLTNTFDFLTNIQKQSLIESLKSTTLVHVSNRFIPSAYTKLASLSKILNMGELDKNFINELNLQIPSLPKAVEKNIQRLKKQYQYIIGVQFYTCHDSDFVVKRSWSLSNAQKFICLCEKNGIGVINLSPHENTLETALDLSALNINQLFAVINGIDLFVGIDSCCSHIAGVLKKNNIVLLGKVLNQKTQRPLCNNFTLISKQGDIDKIDVHYVYQKAIDVLTGKILLRSKIQKIYDYQYDIEYC